MLFKTKFFNYVIQLLNNFKEKVSIVQKAFSLVLLSLFTGFLFGNLFGTFLDTLRLYFVWNGFIGLFVLLFIELLNFLVYGIRSSTPSGLQSNLSNFRKFEVTTYNKKSLAELPDVNNDVQNSPLQAVDDFRHKDVTRNSVNHKVLSEFSNFKIFSLKPSIFPHIFFKNGVYIKRMFNSFKIGLLFGFFVDSFKVGS